MSSPISDKLRAHVNLLEELYSRSLRYLDEETIHDLRVTIKRIRAYDRLFKFHSQDLPLFYQYVDHIKPVFKKAGKIRDIHIFLGLVEDKETIIQNRLFEVLENNSKAYRQFLEDFSIAAGGIFSELKTIQETNPTAFIQHLRDQIANTLKEHSVSEAKLHEIRKKIKMIAELQQFIEQQIDLEDFSSRLGEWHDRLVFQEYCQENHFPLENDIYTITEMKEILLSELKPHFGH